jgi:tetratricopeptide (TPR) repeat protein
MRKDSENQLDFRLPIGPLIEAFFKAGKIEKAVLRFGDALKDIAERANDREVSLVFDEVQQLTKPEDIWRILEVAEKFGEASGDKDLQRWFLESLVLTCYAGLSANYIHIVYDGLKRKRHESDEVKLKKRKDLLFAYGNLSNLDQAFQIFRRAYRKLAELDDNKELQEACQAFKERSEVWPIYEGTKRLAERYRHRELRAWLHYVLASFASESVVYYGKTGETDKAQAIYYDIGQIIQRYGETEPQLLRAQVKGAANLIYVYVTAEKPDEARAVYQDLRKLVGSYPWEPKFRFLLANRASDIIYAYATASEPDEARAVYEELSKLAEDHPKEPKLKVWQAEGAFDLTWGYAKAGKGDEAKAIFQRLEELVEDENAVGEEMRRRKIDEMPMMDWLRQLLQK